MKNCHIEDVGRVSIIIFRDQLQELHVRNVQKKMITAFSEILLIHRLAPRIWMNISSAGQFCAKKCHFNCLMSVRKYLPALQIWHYSKRRKKVNVFLLAPFLTCKDSPLIVLPVKMSSKEEEIDVDLTST